MQDNAKPPRGIITHPASERVFALNIPSSGPRVRVRSVVVAWIGAVVACLVGLVL